MQRLTKITSVGIALLMVGTPAMTYAQAESSSEAASTDDAVPAEEAALADPAAGGSDLEATMALGEELYLANCAACHGEQGDGPERVFVGNENLEYPVVIASQVIHGGEFMPRFENLDDEQIAAIGTYIRNSWGNDMGPVTAEEIAAYR